MWAKAENSESTRPLEIEYSGSWVIIRRDFKLIEETEEFPEHYEWQEWQMTKDQYEVYKNFEDLINEQSDALVELADLISEVV